MEPYAYFSAVYDLMMQDVPYEKWMEYVITLFDKYELKPETILDLGCGTGTITTMLAKKGYEMIGIDLSEDMLLVAREKAAQSGQDILFLCQDMVEMELYGTVDVILSLCDSLNYITDEEALLETFRKANNYLNPGGLFIFDLNTVYKFRQMGEKTYAETYENSAFIWENEYDESEQINAYRLTLFIENQGSYERFEEEHYERAYDIETVKRLLDVAGLKFEGVYAELRDTAPCETTERMYFVAREVMKQKQQMI